MSHMARGGGGRFNRTPGEKPKDVKKTALRIFKYMGNGKYLAILILFMLAINTAASITGTFFLRPLINDYIIPGDFEGLFRMLMLLLSIYLTSALANFIQARTTIRLAQRTTNALRRDLFEKMQDLPLKYYDTHTHGELMSRYTNDADNVQTMLEQSLTGVVQSLFMLIGAIFGMIMLSLTMFAMTLVVLFIMFFVIKKIGGKSQTFHKTRQKVLGELNGNIEEAIGGLREIKAFNREEVMQEEFSKLNGEFKEVAGKANFLANAIMPIMVNLNNISYAATSIFGGILTVWGRFTIGDLTSYLVFSRQLGHPINQITTQLNNVFSAIAGAERIFALMDSVKEVDEGTITLEEISENGNRAWNWVFADGSKKALKGDVELKNVFFSYEEEKPVLKNISLTADSGQMIAFVGSTGAGKTTITNLLNRFYDTQGGEILFDGINVRDIKKESLRRSLGMVLQDTHLFSDTVMNNIRYGRLGATDEECITAAKKSNAHGFISRLPKGYDTEIKGDGSNLSQGERQLLAIARAYISGPPVMILDEATSSIDTRTEHLIQQGMKELMTGRTVFVIAHRLSTVRNSQEIIVLEHGEIIEKGTHNELVEQKGRYYELYTGAAILS